MYIEIDNFKKTKKILLDEFKTNYKKCNSYQEKKYMKIKVKHSFDCLKILKKWFPKLYKEYLSAVLLHDIGRFSEYKKIQNFKHEDYGCEFLKEKCINNPLIILPIKYHEKDLNWKEIIMKEKEYLECSLKTKQKIIECSEVLRDIDVISNMKSFTKNKCGKEIQNINYTLLNKLKTGELAEKEDIKNEYDEIVYILCGLSIISNQNSWNYLKKYRIVEKLICLLYKFVSGNKNNILITKEIEKILYDKYRM